MLQDTLKSNSFFGQYSDKILQLCNETFSTMYANIFKRYWHDGKFMSRMPCNYCKTDWKDGVYEVHIPTREDPEFNMAYYRIIVKVLPELDMETAKQESQKLQASLNPPMGYKDSELIVLVSPKLKKRGFLRAFKHVKRPGFLTGLFVTKVPEIAFKRLLTVLKNFFQRRIAKLLERLEVRPWHLDYKEDTLYYINDVTYIIEHFSHGIACTVKCFSHCLSWFVGKIRSVKHEIGVQNMIKLSFRPLREMPKRDQFRVLEALQVQVNGHG